MWRHTVGVMKLIFHLRRLELQHAEGFKYSAIKAITISSILIEKICAANKEVLFACIDTRYYKSESIFNNHYAN